MLKEEDVFTKHKCPFQNAVMGNVVTRFPPEPSGFLHVGHAKAVIVNYYYAKMFKGKMIMRFDDTNPSKEKEDYVQSIMQDVKTLGVTPDVITHTSDYFPQLMQYMEQFIKDGLAYTDDTPKEQVHFPFERDR
jgi:glutamyl-tRNA synthetase